MSHVAAVIAILVHESRTIPAAFPEHGSSFGTDKRRLLFQMKWTNTSISIIVCYRCFWWNSKHCLKLTQNAVSRNTEPHLFQSGLMRPNYVPHWRWQRQRSYIIAPNFLSLVNKQGHVRWYWYRLVTDQDSNALQTVRFGMFQVPLETEVSFFGKLGQVSSQVNKTGHKEMLCGWRYLRRGEKTCIKALLFMAGAFAAFLWTTVQSKTIPID